MTYLHGQRPNGAQCWMEIADALALPDDVEEFIACVPWDTVWDFRQNTDGA